MPIKLKLKAPLSLKDDSKDTPSLPKLKIKPPSSSSKSPGANILSIGKKKIKVGKEKTKLKLSLTNKKPIASIDEPQVATRIVPKVRVKPTRIPGEGYDSEAPDVEDDPLIEQGFVIRFLNDSNIDTVHNAVESGDLTGINVKWITKDKAVVNVKGTFYSARLIDLPSLTELYKTVDKKNIFKTLDIWQMLLVLKEIHPSDLSVERDFEIPQNQLYTHPLYKMSPKNEIKPSRLVFKDGLLNPYNDVYRRFRPRKINHRVMDDIDSRVNELIRLDDEAEESHFELMDPKKEQGSRFGTMSGSPSSAPTPVSTIMHNTAMNLDMDQENEEQEVENEYEIASDLEEELAKALANDESGIDLGNTEILIEGDEEQEIDGEVEEEIEEEEEEEEEEEDDDDDDDEEIDEESKADKQHFKMLEEEVADLEKAVEVHRKGLASATHKMMKMKFQTSFNTLKSSLESKKRELAKFVSEQEQLNEKLEPYKIPSLNHKQNEEDDNDDEDDDDEGDDDEVKEYGADGIDQENSGVQDDDIDDLF